MYRSYPFLFQVLIETVDLNFGNAFAFHKSMATWLFWDQTVIISDAIIVVLSPCIVWVKLLIYV